MSLDINQIKDMTDVQVASAILAGGIKDFSDADWSYLSGVRPVALKIYAVALGVLGYLPCS